MKTASSDKTVGQLKKLVYTFKLLKMRLAGGHHTVGAWDEVEEYETVLRKYDKHYGGTLAKHQALEIGYGARPWRLLTLASSGIDVVGIDLDQPTYGFNISRLFKTLGKNGPERFAKSFVRSLLFDRHDLKLLKAELQQRGKTLAACDTRLRVGNAAERNHFPANSFTFIYSEDVFEHIPASTLPDVVENMYHWMLPNGIALIRPNIYTGITGGHDPDYYAHKVQLKEINPHRAWAHLWDPHFEVNTYLNKVRLSDYIALFEKRFHILVLKQKHDQLGLEFLEGIRKNLPHNTYSDEELLSNQVAFILKSKKETA